ncbi:MAG: DMT family transporter [Steroidobacteraceae bacterium]|nr:DMT family transporter [Steroidobacteraceae bacterium]MBP7013482.1 DMT family transporter [Steroidobacteraceae bacterium]
MPPARKALLQIHLCVVIWGFTAILGKLITLPAFALVWWRMLLVVLALPFVPAFWRGVRRMSLRTVAIFSGIGVVVALHWVTFYGAIKLANASVAATCMGVAPIIMSVVEPWITHRRFDPRELVIGIAAVPGVMLVIGGTPGGMRLGIAAGVLSALLAALFGSLNKRFVESGEPLAVTGLELAAGTVFLTALAVSLGGDSTRLPLPDARDASLLLVLSIACTLFPFALSLVALRRLSAFSAQLAVSLEPVYAVVLAMLLLSEQRELGLQFYAGLALILGSVAAHAALKRA